MRIVHRQLATHPEAILLFQNFRNIAIPDVVMRPKVPWSQKAIVELEDHRHQKGHQRGNGKGVGKNEFAMRRSGGG